jgi:hypothetical protein
MGNLKCFSNFRVRSSEIMSTSRLWHACCRVRSSVGRAATRSYSCCSWGMRKLEAASVRKMLHRLRMRRRDGVGKGSGLVTGED